ncbi:MAG TPA: hydrogenase maturation protease [Terracidiphilus sp.]|jgi:hydrogenase maturation protease
MNRSTARCLILACGNTLRGDDGIGPWLSAWSEERFEAEPLIRVIARQQWTPDLAEDVAQAEFVIFVDCSIESAPGEVRIVAVEPAAAGPGLGSHHVGAAELLALGQELYDSLPRASLLLTVGAGSIELGETFSKKVIDALPEACAQLEQAVRGLLESEAQPRQQT